MQSIALKDLEFFTPSLQGERSGGVGSTTASSEEERRSRLFPTTLRRPCRAPLLSLQDLSETPKPTKVPARQMAGRRALLLLVVPAQHEQRRESLGAFLFCLHVQKRGMESSSRRSLLNANALKRQLNTIIREVGLTSLLSSLRLIFEVLHRFEASLSAWMRSIPRKRPYSMDMNVRDHLIAGESLQY